MNLSHQIMTDQRLARALALLDECLNNWASIDFDSAAWDRRTKELLDECREVPRE